MSTLDDLTKAVRLASPDMNSDLAIEAAERLCTWLKANPDDVAAFDTDLLKTLRNDRQFAALRMLAEALNGLGLSAPAVRLALAQSLIDTQAPSTAIDVLRRVTGKSRVSKADRVQAHGLTGRAFKDLFMRTGSGEKRRQSELLNLAVEHYATAFKTSGDKNFWAGENLVGLVRKAKRLGLKARKTLDPDEISKNLQTLITKTPDGKRDYWQWATLGVLQIADQNWEEAYRSIRRAVSHRDVSAFALAGTIRQLQEIWDLDAVSEEGAGLLVTLQARQLQLSRGQVNLTPAEMQRARATPEEQFEKIFGPNGPQTRAWMTKFLDQGESVGLISKRLSRGMGTCFIVDGGDFHGSLTGEKLILTNDHVISPAPEKYQSAPPLRMEQAEVSFEVFSDEHGLDAIEPAEIIWSSGAQDHDACLMRLKTALPDELKAIRTTPYVPIVDKDNPEDVYVIGHPGGRGLSYSMQNNDLLDHDCDPGGTSTDPRRIHYVTPTEPGSSGSPAMNADLEVIGLHHAGAKYMSRLNGQPGTYAANEAIWIEAIKRGVRANLDAGESRWTP